MTQARRRLGAEGESLAAHHLEREGYRILARNVRCDGVEIDLVAGRGRLRVFVEVKTRSHRGAGAPEEAVDARKQARLARGAGAWLHAHGRPGLRARFDVIAVERDGAGGFALRHLRDAFEAPAR